MSSNKWFYSTVHYKGDKIYIKGYKQDGTPIKGSHEFKPFLFTVGAGGGYKTFDENKELTKKIFDSYEKMTEFHAKNPDRNFGLGVQTERIGKNDLLYTFLSDAFPSENIDYNLNYIGILNYDIETTSEEGFPDYLNPVEEVLSISCSVLRNGKRIYKTFGTKFVKDPSIKDYERCDDEHEMLKKFCKFVKDSNVDVITGWNTTKFDMPYICSRIEKYFDKEWLKMLSPFGLMPRRIHKKTMNQKTKQMEEYDVYDIAGISDLDMMRLFAKFDTYNGSHALNNIANRELGEKKLDYSEYGSLHKLWKEDWDLFIRYNQHDVVLVDKLVDKLKYIDLAITIAYLAKIKYEDAFSPVKTWDNLIYNYLYHEKKIIVPLRKENKKDHQNRGGRVKDAKKGFSEYVVTTDAESLYPSIMISLNISPETFVKKLDIHEHKVLTMDYNTAWLKEANYGLAANGCCFDNSKEGVLSHIVSSIFQQRKDYKNLMKAEMKKGENSDENLIKKYDVFQYSLKILINSAYGVFSSPAFRFYDLDIAEAITVTGQTIIQLSDLTINSYLNDYLRNKKIRDYVVFSDTDSCGIELADVIKKEKPENFVDFLDEFYNDKIDPEIKKAFVKFSNFCNFYKNCINFKREKIIEKMIITGKKRYGMMVWDTEGFRYDKAEMVIKGLEVVRSDTPEIVKEKLNDSVFIILNKTEKDIQKFVLDFKKEFYKLPLEEIAQPTGVYGMEKYNDDEIIYKKGSSSHIKAALIHNDFITRNGLEKDYELIKNADKVKVICLKIPNPMFNDRFAVKYKFDNIFGIDKYIDYNKQYETTFLAPLKRLLDSVGWEAEESNAFDI